MNNVDDENDALMSGGVFEADDVFEQLLQDKLNKTQKEKIEEKLTVHITQKNGTIIAQFQFPIELIENIFLLSNGARGGQNNSGDDKNKDLFSKAPLLMTVNNKQEGSSRQYRVDSILTLSLQKGTEGYLFFIKASPKSASSELTVQTKWIGKSLYTIYNDGPRFGFAVRPREIDQLDRKWEKAFFDTIELVEFRMPVKFFRPAKIISFENEQIDEVYTLQVQISNEENFAQSYNHATKARKLHIIRNR